MDYREATRVGESDEKVSLSKEINKILCGIINTPHYRMEEFHDNIPAPGAGNLHDRDNQNLRRMYSNDCILFGIYKPFISSALLDG